ncbi:RCC1-like G exchanging factor-like protein [Hetaerina americana]|uniref:RCC1-like G exchanging factor-like protein n=1 Tax=Hetaerina americana TaxID=62018 RepID=UPI003A7F19F7
MPVAVNSTFSLELHKIFLKCHREIFLRSLRNYGKRRYPVNIEEADDLPVHNYSPGEYGTHKALRVYGWGNGEHGGLGNQIQIQGKRSPPRMLHRPSRLHFAETHKVTDIACGYGFSAFAVDSKEHQLFGTGINTDSQIGYHAVRRGHPLGLLLAPVPISRFPPVHSGKSRQASDHVAGLSAGRAHLLVLMASGSVYTFGSNHYGQCGHPSKETKEPGSLHIPHCIPKAPDGSKFVKVECGQDHSLFLTEKGEVWGCGWGADGQMGQGDTLSSWKLQHLTGDFKGNKIVKLSSTADTILALSEDGEVFGWGNNEYGQLLTINPTPQISIPKKLKLPPNVGRVKDVAAGGSFCLVTNVSGEVFVWGYGLLGLGPSADYSQKPLQIPPTLFGAGVFQETPKVEKVAAGLSYSVAILSNGDMYSWGHNTQGCLGLGHRKDQPFPLKVAVGAEVIKVSCGVDHLLALCRPFA